MAGERLPHQRPRRDPAQQGGGRTVVNAASAEGGKAKTIAEEFDQSDVDEKEEEDNEQMDETEAAGLWDFPSEE